MKNAIFVIKPYKWNGMWVFDDERVGLDKEPFVAPIWITDDLISAQGRRGITRPAKCFEGGSIC